MAKLTKAQSKTHQQAMALLEKDVLTYDEKWFVIENYHEGAEHNTTRHGAFFTPADLANDFKLDVHGPKVLDLCAGIGGLAFAYFHNLHHKTPPQITCVELNPEYVRIGKKLLPEANWICGDVFEIWQDLPDDFDSVISNPPFGKVKHEGKAPRYTGAEFELKIIDIAGHLGRWGAFIIPQMSCPFRYSGAKYYQRKKEADCEKYATFFKQTGIDLEAGCGIDTDFYAEDWKQVCVRVEIAVTDFRHPPDRAHMFARETTAQAETILNGPNETAQLALF